MANQFGDVNFGELAAGEQFQKESASSGNVAAERATGAALTSAGTGAVEGFFQEEKAKTARQMAADEARTQTEHMKRSMTLQKENFDTSLRNERRLAGMDAAASKALLGTEKQIKEDSFGRKMLSENQLADWYATRATSEEDWANYNARSTQLHERKVMILKASYAKIEQAERQAFAKWGQQVDQELMTTLAEKKSIMEKKIQSAQIAAANRSAMISTMGGIASTVVSGYISGKLVGGASGGTGGTTSGLVTGSGGGVTGGELTAAEGVGAGSVGGVVFGAAASEQFAATGHGEGVSGEGRDTKYASSEGPQLKSKTGQGSVIDRVSRVSVKNPLGKR